MRKFAETLKPGDLVVANSKNGFAVVVVKSIDEFTDIPPEDDGVFYTWAFQKVDTEMFEAIISDESKIVDALKSSQRKRLRDQYLASIGGEVGLLSINDMGKPATPPIIE